jgi:RNA polymerase subunit RPABC4/transcription elongation factor Spt4
VSDEDDDTVTGADVFGTPIPGEAVKPKDVDRYANDRPRQRFRYRRDGRPIPHPDNFKPDDLERELPKGSMPNINDSFPSNYLKASDLQGRQVVVTMDRVEFEPVGRDKEMKAVLYFVGKQKGVVLNKTNAKKITEIAGSALTEEWQGVAVVLYPTETEFAGETVDCIRIKAVQKAKMQRMTPLPPPPPAVAEDNHEVSDDDPIPF